MAPTQDSEHWPKEHFCSSTLRSGAAAGERFRASKQNLTERARFASKSSLKQPVFPTVLTLASAGLEVAKYSAVQPQFHSRAAQGIGYDKENIMSKKNVRRDRKEVDSFGNGTPESLTDTVDH